MLEKKENIETKTEIKNGIKYTTRYVGRPIRQGDEMFHEIGTSNNGIETTTEIIMYEYNKNLKL